SFGVSLRIAVRVLREAGIQPIHFSKLDLLQILQEVAQFESDDLKNRYILQEYGSHISQAQLWQAELTELETELAQTNRDVQEARSVMPPNRKSIHRSMTEQWRIVRTANNLGSQPGIKQTKADDQVAQEQNVLARQIRKWRTELTPVVQAIEAKLRGEPM